MEELVKSLEALFSSDTKTDSNGYFNENEPLAMSAIDNLWEYAFNGTHPKYSVIRELQKVGYDLHAGDRDSFGWLTAVVEKDGDDRRLMFG